MDFCDHFLDCGNAERAAKLAGYADKTAKKKAAYILRKPHVAAFLKAQVEKRWEEERMGNSEILGRLARIARFDPRKLVNDDGSFKPLHELDAATANALREFKTELILGKEGGDLGIAVRNYKFPDPIAALRTLAQINQLLQPETAHVQIFMDLDSRMDAARRRQREANEKKVVSEQ